jgi:perosamine synthetase
VHNALSEVYASGDWGRYQGSYGSRLAGRLSELTSSPHVWLCSSGTIAVELALRGLKIQPGDEVILAAYDFPGNFRAIEAVGARPVLVDLAAGSWTLDSEQVAVAVSPQTRAVIVSHLHGSLADMRALREIADREGLAIVEDACQAPGALVQGRAAGSWGDCGVFSFGGSKLLTAGRGGAIVTRREDVLQRIRIFCERGNDAFPLSELQAAVLLPQLEELNAANETRRRNVELLLDRTRHATGLTALRASGDQENQRVYYKLPWLLQGNSDACDTAAFEQWRSRFIAAIQAEGVAMDAGFRGFARRQSSRCRAVGELRQARAAAAGTLLLHHPVLLENAATMILAAEAIRKVSQALLGSA